MSDKPEIGGIEPITIENPARRNTRLKKVMVSATANDARKDAIALKFAPCRLGMAS